MAATKKGTRAYEAYEATHTLGKHEKQLVGTVFNRVREFMGQQNKTRYTSGELFQFLTNVSASTGLEYGNQLLNGTPFEDPKPPGPAPSDVDARFVGFYDWVMEKVEGAKKNSYLTLPGLRRDLQREHGLPVSLGVLRRTLKRLGFRYLRRVGKWISRRNEPRVQQRLWSFLDYTVKHTQRTEVTPAELAASRAVSGEPPRKRTKKAGSDGKLYTYSWNFPVAFQDESFIQEGGMNPFSWCAKGDKGFDFKKKGKGSRINILHCIFSHEQEQPVLANGRPKALCVWKSTWTGKKHEFKGSTTTANHIDRYFSTRVFPGVGEGGVAVIDNAGTHREQVQDLKGMDDSELDDLIMDKTDGEKGSLRWKLRKEYDALARKLGLGLDAPEMRKFIRTHHLYDTTLHEMAKRFEASLVYLPQYHPECNPIERYWALLKRKYYATDPQLNWQERLDLAFGEIPTNFADLCIQKSLEWVYKRHAEMKNAGWGKDAAPSLKKQVQVVVNDRDDNELDPTDDDASESDVDRA